jgi:hypothetical protein
VAWDDRLRLFDKKRSVRLLIRVTQNWLPPSSDESDYWTCPITRLWGASQKFSVPMQLRTGQDTLVPGR